MTDGTLQVAPDNDIANAQTDLGLYFHGTGITFSFEHKLIKDDWLRNRYANIISSFCQVVMIGDGTCNSYCDLALTGYDGGDCITSPALCDSAEKGDGVCQTACNTALNQYDNGDCCLTATAHTTCFDPSSSDLAWVTSDGWKNKVNLENENKIHVYLVKQQGGILGTAVMPWMIDTHAKTGGVLVDPATLVSGCDTPWVAAHEVGHALGLWHSFIGTMNSCSHRCHEFVGSFSTGDLVKDTAPDWKEESCSLYPTKCGISTWVDPPVKNVMSYHWLSSTCDASPLQSFTPGQTARMQCYLDLVHDSWVTGNTKNTPSFTLGLTIMPGSHATSTKLSWLRPMRFNTGKSSVGCRCKWCNNDKQVLLYGYQATVSGSIMPTGFDHLYVENLLGEPDQKESCSSDDTVYRSFGCYSSSICPSDKDIFIDVTFEYELVPASVTVYMGTTSEPVYITLYNTDGTTQDLGALSGGCATPRTMVISTTKNVKHLRLTLKLVTGSYNDYPTVDAVSLTSVTAATACDECPAVTYEVARDGVVLGATRHRYWEDDTPVTGEIYNYMVTALSSLHGRGTTSPGLSFKTGGSYCGDGKVDDGEACDDGNVIEGDGCDLGCNVEDGYQCTKPALSHGGQVGLPSVCTLSCGDGICEASEHLSCLADCGSYEMEGNFDQWAANVSYTLDSCTYNCNTGPSTAHEVSGRPTTYAECASVETGVFVPGNKGTLDLTFEVSVIPTAIDVYVTNSAVKMTVKLVTDSGEEISIEDTSHFAATCHAQPWTYTFSKPYSIPPRWVKRVKIYMESPSYDLGYSFANAQITAVRLRSTGASLQAGCALAGPGKTFRWDGMNCISGTVNSLPASNCDSFAPILNQCVKSDFCSLESQKVPCFNLEIYLI